MTVTRLHLVRHGATTLAGSGVLAGRLDPPLSPAGEGQAAAAAAALAGRLITRVVSSPRARALATARAVAAPHRLPVEQDADLAELDFGEAEGLTFDAVAARWPAVARTWAERPAEVRFPGGEDYADLAARVRRAAARLAQGTPAAEVVLVAHAGPIRVLLGLARGLAPDEALRLPLAHGEVASLELRGGLLVVPGP